jgi:subtilisin family serine protease
MIQIQYSLLLQPNNFEKNHSKKLEFPESTTLSTQIQHINSKNDWHSVANVKTTDVVVFAENEIQYRLLKELSYSKAYDNLLAIKTKLSRSDQNALNALSVLVKPFHLYTKADLLPNSLVNSQIELNAVDEAVVLGVSNLWDMGFIGQENVIGIIDNGVNFDHPDLIDQEFASKNFTIPGATIRYNHGTPVAGIIAASGMGSNDSRGTAYGAKIASANMGQSADGYLVGDFLEAFNWLANITGLHVINTSWSGGGEDVWLPIVQRLEKLDIIVVGAAGNEGLGILNVLGSPANTVHGLSIASSDLQGIPSSFSSQGPVGGGFAKPDLVAPGQNIVSTNTFNGYSSNSGTSFSAPLVSGAVATLISGLQNNSIPFNVGLIKSSLMKTAQNPNEYLESRVGQGMLNATEAFELIVNRSLGNASVPLLTTATPKHGFFSQLTNLRQNTISKIPFTLISSVPKNVSLGIEGNISLIFDFPEINQTMLSQAIFVNSNTTDIDLGNYGGNITISDDLETIRIPINISIKAGPRFKVLFDLRHTAADFGYTVYRAGYTTGSFIEVINQKGGWVDMIDAEFTTDLLNQYDLVWFPDPFGIMGLEETDISNDEINALHDFVESGGNLFIHYSGRFTDSLANSVDEQIVGTDISKLNLILNPYDMEASGENPDLIEYFNSENHPTSVAVYNNSILGFNITEITTFEPTQIETFGDAKSLTSNNILATWSQTSSGRVLVSSTDSWFSSQSADNDHQSNDYRFMQNVIDWLIIQPRIEIESLIVNDRELQLEIHITNNSQYLDATPEVDVLLNQNFVEEINLEQLGTGVHLLTLKFEIDENYRIQITFGNDYVNLPITIDNTPPTIIPISFKEKYSVSDNITLKFVFSDSLSGISHESITTLIDNVNYTEGTYNQNNQTMVYLFESGVFDKGSHELIIQLSDNANNNVSNTYIFTIDDFNDDENTGDIVVIILILAMTVVLIVRYFLISRKSKK